MKFTYHTATGAETIEITEEWNEILLQLDHEEELNDRNETRRYDLRYLDKTLSPGIRGVLGSIPEEKRKVGSAERVGESECFKQNSFRSHLEAEAIHPVGAGKRALHSGPGQMAEGRALGGSPADKERETDC